MLSSALFKPAQPETKLEPIELGKKVLAEIKKTVVSNFDIISWEKLPFLMLGDIESYNQKFGKDLVDKLFLHRQYTSLANRMILAFQNADIPSPMTTLSVAITLLGIGESQAVSNLAIIKLSEAGFKNLHMMAIMGKPRVGQTDTNNRYDDCFVLSGDVSPIKNLNSLADLDKLNDDCLLFHAKLNIVIPANKFNALMKDYITTFGFDKIYAFHPVPEVSAEYRATVMANAKTISDKVGELIEMHTGEPFPVFTSSQSVQATKTESLDKKDEQPSVSMGLRK